MSVQEIETAITKLPAQELSELATWLENFLNSAWDQQIEEDEKSGRLDALFAEAEADFLGRTARLRTLDAV